MSRSAPSDIQPNLQQAFAFHQQGRLEEAEQIYARLLERSPSQFDSLHLLGVLKLQKREIDEAHRLILAALAIEPRSADVLTNLGLVLRALGRNREALARFDEALRWAPDHVEALNNRGLLLLLENRAEEALACFDHVLRLAPWHIARLNRGNALTTLGRLEEAISEYDRALATSPGHPVVLFNHGNALHGLGRYDEAVASFDRSVAAAPQHPETWNNRGIALYALNRHSDALSSYSRALAVRPDYPDAHYNEALSLLATGDFSRGLPKYEWRTRRTGAPAQREWRAPLWLGDYPLEGKTILLHAEQGLGDTIQFARYAPLLARRGARVVMEVQPELTEMLSELDRVDRVIARGAELPPFDVHCPLPSLPLALGTDLASVPANVPYLFTPAKTLTKWLSRLEALGRPRIALAWSGNALHTNDPHRSIPFSRLDGLLATDAHFVSIQRELRRGEIELLRKNPRIVHVGDELEDFTHTAAVIALVDLVISVDTSVAHLAGAMGRPVFLLLPFAADWRWLLDREDSPWYPTARLFRQPALGDWSSVMARVVKELCRTC